MKKMGSLTLGIRKYKRMEAFYSVFFLLRRFIFAVLLLSLSAQPALIISYIELLNIAAIAYFGLV